MIDLSKTRSELLASIGVVSLPQGGQLIEDVRSPAEPETRVTFSAQEPGELIELVSGAFSERFAHIPRAQISRDLLQPIRSALGNAHKRGNKQAAHKRIEVEAIVTDVGVVVAVTDEGDGFDASQVLQQFRQGQGYFEHHGAGTAAMERAESIISYENGGRTCLICFQAKSPVRPSSFERIAEPTWGFAADERLMTDAIAEALGTFRERGSTIESLRIFTPTQQRDANPEFRYVVHYRRQGDGKLRSKELTGRLLSEAEARMDYKAATQLTDERIYKSAGWTIPKPIRLKHYPRLLLYEFTPSPSLRDFARSAELRDEAFAATELVGRDLHTLHESKVSFRRTESPTDIRARLEGISEKLRTSLRGNASQTIPQFERLAGETATQLEAMPPFEPRPIHGAFDWNCITRAGDTFFLYNLENCKLSHPWMDVGSFLAELLADSAAGSIAPTVRSQIQSAFLRGYFGDRNVHTRDLRPFIRAQALARTERRCASGQFAALSDLLCELEQWE